MGFFVPPDAPPGVYRLVVVVYNPANDEELTTPAGTQFAVENPIVAARVDRP